MYISARIRDSNEIPMAKPMFPESDNRFRLLGKLSYVWVCRKLKMALINRKSMGNYGFSQQGLAIGNTVNIAIAVEILLITYIRVEQ